MFGSDPFIPALSAELKPRCKTQIPRYLSSRKTYPLKALVRNRYTHPHVSRNIDTPTYTTSKPAAGHARGAHKQPPDPVLPLPLPIRFRQR
jgi:hypothetical protein